MPKDKATDTKGKADTVSKIEIFERMWIDTKNEPYYTQKEAEWLMDEYAQALLSASGQHMGTSKKDIIQAQLEVVQGYYNKISMNSLSVSDILDTLEKDREFLQQEQNVLDASPPTPSAALAQTESKWIDCGERLPEKDKIGNSLRVLCITNTTMISIGFTIRGEWYRDDGHTFEKYGYTITHWQPLPPNPKEVKP